MPMEFLQRMLSPQREANFPFVVADSEEGSSDSRRTDGSGELNGVGNPISPDQGDTEARCPGTSSQVEEKSFLPKQQAKSCTKQSTTTET